MALSESVPIHEVDETGMLEPVVSSWTETSVHIIEGVIPYHHHTRGIVFPKRLAYLDVAIEAGVSDVGLPAAIKNNGRLRVRELVRGRQIEIGLGVGHSDNVYEERNLIGGLAELRVDLARHGLSAIYDRWRAFGDLDAFHPRAGDERKAEGSAESPHHRTVLLKHLEIYSRKAEEADLSSASDGI